MDLQINPEDVDATSGDLVAQLPAHEATSGAEFADRWILRIRKPLVQLYVL